MLVPEPSASHCRQNACASPASAIRVSRSCASGGTDRKEEEAEREERHTPARAYGLRILAHVPAIEQ